MKDNTGIRLYNLYLIRVFNKTEDFFKIGTSVHKYCRFYEIMKAGYDIEIVYMILGLDFQDCYGKERFLHNHFQSISYETKRKFGGYRECFSGIPLDEYKRLTSDLNNSNLITNLPITWR